MRVFRRPLEQSVLQTEERPEGSSSEMFRLPIEMKHTFDDIKRSQAASQSGRHEVSFRRRIENWLDNISITYAPSRAEAFDILRNHAAEGPCRLRRRPIQWMLCLFG